MVAARDPLGFADSSSVRLVRIPDQREAGMDRRSGRRRPSAGTAASMDREIPAVRRTDSGTGPGTLAAAGARRTFGRGACRRRLRKGGTEAWDLENREVGTAAPG